MPESSVWWSGRIEEGPTLLRQGEREGILGVAVMVMKGVYGLVLRDSSLVRDEGR